MVAEVIKFPNNKPVIPSPEELEDLKLQLIEECIDRHISNFVVEVAEYIPDVDMDRLENIDTSTQKVIALVRESMRATIYMLQGEHHDLQIVADEIISFDENAREHIIEENE